jgi:hypothetical protein
LESVHRVIGLWAIEVAEKYCSARVIGIDLAPVQPALIPSNCQFVIGDAMLELLEFHDCSADLINSRYNPRGIRSINCFRFIIMGLKKSQWVRYYEEAFRIIIPGGYIQACEIDHWEFQDSSESSILRQFFDYLNKYHASHDLFDFRDGVVPQHKPLMELAGFVDIKIHRKSADHGDWRVGQSPVRAAASRACLEALPSSMYTFIVENLFGEYIPDPAERHTFGEKVRESVDGTGHFSCHMYLFSICHL